MVRYLLTVPALLMLALLPAAIILAAIIRLMPSRLKIHQFIALVALTCLSLAVIGHLLFAVLNLNAPAFLDYIEVTFASVAWIYAEGGQIYHSIDSPVRYSLLYGPVPYIATAWIYEIFGPSTAAAKSTGFVCLLLTFTFLGLSVRKQFRGQLLPYVAGLGYFSITSLLFFLASFWLRADPFIMFAAAVGLYSCMMNRKSCAWLSCAIALGIAVNAKFTGAIYFLPYLAWFYDRDGFRPLLIILPVAWVTVLLPFASPDQVSLPNYIDLLKAAGSHGIVWLAFIYNLLMLAFLVAPVAFFCAWQLLSSDEPTWLSRFKLIVAASMIALLLVCVISAKSGAGPHHFLPFLPALAFLTASVTASVYSRRPTTNLMIYGYWVPVAAFLAAALVQSATKLYQNIISIQALEKARFIKEELNAIVTAHPGQPIYMGYGDGERLGSIAVRTELAFAGYTPFLELPALQDFQLSGNDISPATIGKMLSEWSCIWLIPAGEAPFTMVNWYYLDSGKPLFDANFQSAFNKNFFKSDSGKYFDLYIRKGQGIEGEDSTLQPDAVR